MPHEKKLNTDDLVRGIDYFVTRGRGDAVKPKDFDFIFETKNRISEVINEHESLKELAHSSVAKTATSAVVKVLDANQDGKITSKDFALMYQWQKEYLERHRDQIDPYLPFAGQCAFGLAVGYIFGRTAKYFWRKKVPIIIFGGIAFASGQYLMDQGIVNREIVKYQFEKKVQEVADYNKDGKIDRADLAFLIEKRMKIVNEKLGPGGFAPGHYGVATFTLGLLRGMFRRVK